MEEREQLDIERAKELFAYEMTEVALRLRGEYAHISREQLLHPELPVDEQRLVVGPIGIPTLEPAAPTATVPETAKVALEPLPEASVPVSGITMPEIPKWKETETPVPVAPAALRLPEDGSGERFPRLGLSLDQLQPAAVQVTIPAPATVVPELKAVSLEALPAAAVPVSGVAVPEVPRWNAPEQPAAAAAPAGIPADTLRVPGQFPLNITAPAVQASAPLPYAASAAEAAAKPVVPAWNAAEAGQVSLSGSWALKDLPSISVPQLKTSAQAAVSTAVSIPAAPAVPDLTAAAVADLSGRSAVFPETKGFRAEAPAEVETVVPASGAVLSSLIGHKPPTQFPQPAAAAIPVWKPEYPEVPAAPETASVKEAILKALLNA